MPRLNLPLGYRPIVRYNFIMKLLPKLNRFMNMIKISTVLRLTIILIATYHLDCNLWFCVHLLMPHTKSC